MNRDFEFLGNALEKFNKKDTNHRLILINIQKLATFMEAPDVLLYLENNHDFVKSIPKPLLILYFMKKLERETKVILSGIKKKGKENNVYDVLSNFFDQDVSHNLSQLHSKFEDLANVEFSTMLYLESVGQTLGAKAG